MLMHHLMLVANRTPFQLLLRWGTSWDNTIALLGQKNPIKRPRSDATTPWAVVRVLMLQRCRRW